MEFQPYWILQDTFFEKRLRAFDPNLRLVFDQVTKRWRIIEKALDGDGWNIILTLEDNEGNPKPMGEWVFNTLFVWRHRGEERNRNVDQFFWNEREEENRQREEMDKKADEIGVYFWKHNIREMRKIAREMNGEPGVDEVAGFRKVEFKPKTQGVRII